MGWWQGAFKRSSDDDNDDRTSWYSLKPRFFSSRRNRNARKIRHVARNQVDVWRSSSHSELSRDTALPLPLPLPDLHVLLRDDPRSASTHSVPLPSPDTAQNLKKGCDDKERERDGERQTTEAVLNTDAIDVPNGLNRLIGQDTSMENVEKSTKKQTSKGISYRINIPTSAPASPYTSPVLSPPNSDHMLATQNYTNPPSSVYRVWSEPDMAPCDGNIGLGLYKRMPSDRIYSSVDSSPIESPGTSSVYAASPPMPASPNPSPTPVALPLPLPPGAAMPPQPTSTSPVLSSKSEIPVQPSSSIPQVAAKIELMPVKSQWSKGKLIGRGTFGSVYVASNRETGALCAMKEVEILPDDSKSAECIRQLEQEIKVLSNLKHPNIVQYYGSEIIGDKFYIYLEYVHPGSINKFINDHCGAITESVVRNFTRHILSGLSYLHNTKTIHRDIKGANLLVDANGVVKLADFGMAKHLNGQTANLSLKGSPYWLAPELLQCVMQNDGSGDAALAVDIWSLGCTIIEMMNGKPPWSEYEGAAALFKVLQETPAIPETMSADGKDFLKCCFRRNPAERPTANELLDHPFVNYSQQDNIQIPRPAAAAALSL